MDAFDEVFEFINSKIDLMVPNESDNAFIALGATLDDISASYSGKERSLVSMIIAHMMQNDDIRRIMTVAVKFYYEKHEELQEIEEE